MKNVPYLLLAQVREMFDYDPVSGLLIRKESPHSTAKPGPEFDRHYDGYLRVSINGKRYLNHRIIWLHQKGYWPKQLDHINQCNCDNRMSNLREVTTAQNQRNRKYNIKFGIPGVKQTRSKTKDFRWYVYITMRGKNYSLGRFDSFTEAVCHRWAAEQCIDEESYGFNSAAKLYVKEFIQNRIHCTPINEEPIIITKPKKKKQEKKLYRKKPKLTFMQYQQKLAQVLSE